MAEIIKTFRHDLDTLVKTTYMDGILATGDALANCFSVELYKGKAPYTLPSGAAVKGYFVRKGTDTIELSGTVSGNVVSVTLNSACYNVSGTFTLTIKVIAGGATTTVFHGAGSMIVSRTGNTVNPGYETVEYYKYPVNLLDNSDFGNPVNQRGIVSGQAASAYSYFIDRWATGSTAVTVTFVAGGMTVNGLIRQYVDYSRIAGKTVTFAAKISGIVVVCSGEIPSAYSGSWSQYAITSSSGVQMYVAAGDADKIQMSIKPLPDGETVTIEWAALYEGAYTAETLPPYRPKGYAVEVLACKRYYCAHDIIALHSALMTSHNAIEFSAAIPIRMRAKPTIIITGSSDGGIYQGTDTAFVINGTTISSMGVSVAGESAVRIWLSVSGSPGFTAGREGMVKMPPFSLSADL